MAYRIKYLLACMYGLYFWYWLTAAEREQRWSQYCLEEYGRRY